MRRTIELICAGSVAIGGLMAGMAGPVNSLERGWDPQAAILASFDSQPVPQISNATARTASAIFGFRQDSDNDFATSHTRFVLANPPGPGEVLIEGETRAGRAFQQTGMSSEESARTTTMVRLSAPVEANEGNAIVTPYAGVTLTPEGPEARIGARFQVGDGRGERSRWFLFAAAERQALFYDAAEMSRPLRAIDLTPYSVIGDVQAGVVYRLSHRSDLAMAYVQRDWAYQYGTDKWEESENFTAISFVARW